MQVLVHPDGRLVLRGFVFRAALGRGGVRHDKSEGDGATPAGRFPLRRLLWRADREPAPLTRLAARAIAPNDGWCDDPAHPEYNRPVTFPSYFFGTAERMWRDDHLYDVVVVLGHNDDPPTPGKGSAIFLHVAKPGFAPTEGCVAMAKEDLTALLASVGPEDALTVRMPS